MKRIHNRPELKATRVSLRSNLTSAEAMLWEYLKGRCLDGRKFRRQHSIERYIVDFYCPAEKLIVELDGESHNNDGTIEGENPRQIFLEGLGFKVLRFENRKVFEQLDYVLDVIRGAFKADGTTP